MGQETHYLARQPIIILDRLYYYKYTRTMLSIKIKLPSNNFVAVGPSLAYCNFRQGKSNSSTGSC